jgi:hypothetical protein
MRCNARLDTHRGSPMTLSRTLSAIAVLATWALPVAAHHSPAMFDMTKEVVIEGVVTEISWGNPHVYFGVEVAGPDGRPRVQQVEAGPASNLVTAGMRADSLRPGDRIVLRAKPNRTNPAGAVLGWLLTKSDGVTIPLHVRAVAPTTPGSAVATSIAGTWVPQGTGFSSLAASARDWPLTEAGRAAVAATRDARIAARSECVPYGPPALMSLPSTTVVEVGATTVTFKLDAIGGARVVHLDQASHPKGLEPSVQGHSIGHWDGNTLVVDTVGYAAHPEGYAFDLPSSAAKHVVERFTLNADRKHLDYEAVVDDAEYLASPVTHRGQWDYRPDQQPSGLPCDRGTAHRFVTEQ